LEARVEAEGVPVPGNGEVLEGRLVGIGGFFEPGEGEIVLSGVGVEAGDADASYMSMQGASGEDIASALHGFTVTRSGEARVERFHCFVVIQNFKKADGFGAGFLVHVLFEVRAPEAHVGGREIGISSEDVLEILDGFVVAAEIGEMPAVESQLEVVHGVQSEAAVDFAFPFLIALSGNQEVGVHEMSVGAAGIGVNGALEFPFGGGPVVFVSRGDVGEADVRLGERGIEFDGFESIGFGFGYSFGGRQVTGVRAHEPDVGEAGIGQGVVGISFQSELEVAFGFFKTSFGNLIPVEAALQISLVGLGIDRAGGREARAFLRG